MFKPFTAAVSKYESIEEAERSKFVEYIIKYKNETNQKISEVVDFFNCRIGMLKMPRREFYSNWLSGKCHQVEINDLFNQIFYKISNIKISESA